MNYQVNRMRAQTKNTDPSMTDQSQAKDTDINVIVGRMIKGIPQPGAAGEPLYGDFASLPNDLRTMIETSRSIEKVRHQLPQQLREMPIEELLVLTPDKLTSILTPHEPTKTVPATTQGNTPSG